MLQQQEARRNLCLFIFLDTLYFYSKKQNSHFRALVVSEIWLIITLLVCNLLKNIGKFPYFAFLHYFCSAGGEKTTGLSKHFVKVQKLKFRQNFKQGTGATNAHSVYIPLMCVSTHRGYVYISRRGNIVSSPFILLGRLAMPQFCGRKAQVSRLFLLHCSKLTLARVWQY